MMMIISPFGHSSCGRPLITSMRCTVFTKTISFRIPYCRLIRMSLRPKMKDDEVETGSGGPDVSTATSKKNGDLESGLRPLVHIFEDSTPIKVLSLKCECDVAISQILRTEDFEVYCL
jgi:hypothetical protein